MGGDKQNQSIMKKRTEHFSSAIRVYSPSDPGVKGTDPQAGNAECLGLRGYDQCMARLS